MANNDFPWHIGVFEAHCHVADVVDAASTLSALMRMKARGLVVLASRAENQDTTAYLAQHAGPELGQPVEEWRDDQKIIPGFGWHPWFSHLLFDDQKDPIVSPMSEDDKVAHFQSVLIPSSTIGRDFLLALPNPRPLSAFLAETRRYLARYPYAMIGEIGLDRSFRIPVARLPEHENAGIHVPGGRDGRRLSPFQVSIDHQIIVLQAQLSLAAEMNRAVSVHGVQAHGTLFNVLSRTWKNHKTPKASKRHRKLSSSMNKTVDRMALQECGPGTPSLRICLHSFSGSPDLLKQYLKSSTAVELFFSFSTFNNFSKDSNKAEASVKQVPDHQLLLETDLSHAGDDLDEQLELTARKLCELKGWQLEHGMRQLRRNWLRFVFGQQATSTQASDVA